MPLARWGRDGGDGTCAASSAADQTLLREFRGADGGSGCGGPNQPVIAWAETNAAGRALLVNAPVSAIAR